MNPTNLSTNNPSVTNPATNGLPKHIKVLTTICLALGAITAVGAALVVAGLASGMFLSSPGMAMGSSMLMGIVYLCIKQIGLSACIVNIVFIFVAKNRYNVSTKKPLIITLCSLFVIYMPEIALRLLLSSRM